MWYYKVKADYFTGQHIALIKDELFTSREIDKIFKGELNIQKYVKMGVLKPINLSPKKTFFSFGCRFEKED